MAMLSTPRVSRTTDTNEECRSGWQHTDRLQVDSVPLLVITTVHI